MTEEVEESTAFETISEGDPDYTIVIHIEDDEWVVGIMDRDNDMTAASGPNFKSVLLHALDFDPLLLSAFLGDEFVDWKEAHKDV